MVEGAADNSILSRLQHHIAADKLLHRSLAVGQQAAQGQFVAAAEGGTKHHDAQVQQVTIGRVRAPGKGGGMNGLTKERQEWREQQKKLKGRVD